MKSSLATLILGFTLVAACGGVAIGETAPATPEPATTATPPAAASVAPQAPATTADESLLATVRDRLAALPSAEDKLEEVDREALTAFYKDRHDGALWIADGRLNDRALALAAAFEDASDYGLDPGAFHMPAHSDAALTSNTPEAAADAELEISRAALLYARHARGGRIAEPAEMLNSNLDRKPQLLDPKAVIDGLASASDVAAYMHALHPKHPQFERLRLAYLDARAKSGKSQLSAAAKRLRANMEMWRWMWDDLGDFYVFNNIPEFMQRVYRNSELIRSEKIVAGMIDKQSSVFSRPLKYVVLRPTWRVPESIKVRELWPSLLRGGGLMRQYGLQIETKDGARLDWRKIDWAQSDIRDYEVIQPPGPKSVLGHVKFSFPSQHTIFMHDTPDKWMFRNAQRTLSHGCLRVQKPMELAELILAEDKGWDRAKIDELSRSGPLNNEIAIDKKIPIHLAYFTAWVDDDGRLRTFRDIYGHEKRVTQALDGEWQKIKKGRDHLAPVEPGFDPAGVARSAPTAPSTSEKSVSDIIGDALGLTF